MGRCRSTGRSEKDAVTFPRMKMRIGILTSGGDCPGLNAVLRGAALAADKLGWEVLGFRDGFEGLLPPGDFTILDRKCTENIMALGGTLIGTTNRGHFVAKIGAGDRAVVAAEVIEKARKVLNEARVEALIIVGGDGSMTTALQLQEAGIGGIVVPEIAAHAREATGMSFGGDSARGAAMAALDRILGTRFGVKAVQLVNEGHFGSMVSYQNYQVRHVPIADAVNRLRLVPPHGEMVQTARDVDISFGD